MKLIYILISISSAFLISSKLIITLSGSTLEAIHPVLSAIFTNGIIDPIILSLWIYKKNYVEKETLKSILITFSMVFMGIATIGADINSIYLMAIG